MNNKNYKKEQLLLRVITPFLLVAIIIIFLTGCLQQVYSLDLLQQCLGKQDSGFLGQFFPGQNWLGKGKLFV